MEHNAISIRPFIGAKNFNISRQFYTDLGFTEIVIAPNFSHFTSNGQGFYLQDAYVKDWVDNTMVFLEVENVGHFWQQLVVLGLEKKYEGVRIEPVRHLDWGSECFVHDPSGILWHFGEFANK